MPFIEAPTTFYLGRQYDPNAHQLVDDVVYYDSRDLTTHAVVVGMTGSGKTGLCITLLEEAALDSIPSIIIDPKGDITNLALMFEGLTPEEFKPWINVDDARRAGMSVDEFAQDVSQNWREGLGSWGIGPQRIAALKNAVEINIYTPGSDAGLPISILEAMQAPRTGWVGQEEYHREQIRAITTALLALIGVSANPVKDREHVLIANIFEDAWKQGTDLTLEDIIVRVQQPPFPKLGVLDIDTFFPEKARFKLAMDLNSIIAAPSFQSWLRGDPLDMQSLMYNPQGKPRVNIFYIAHLDEAQRSFIITLLLESILASMRTMSGTTSLRALLYFDEVFGHFPPYPKNPPTKQPLLRLLKQARAFGIGLILATQNPGDLDYKGLSNAGTWFIGRLQTENDKKKVLDGLMTASTAETKLDVADLDRLLSSVDPRVFLMNNVHSAGGPILLHTRWAMSYLRGPLTRDQVFTLMQPRRQQWAQQQQMQQNINAYGQVPQQWAQQQQPYQPYVPPQQSTGGYAPPPAPQGFGQQQQPSQGFTPYTPPPSAPPPPPLPSTGFAAPPSAPYMQNTPPPQVGNVPAPPPNLPEMFSNPATPPPGLPENIAAQYNPQNYQAPPAPYFQQQPEQYAPQGYVPPPAPYQPQAPQGQGPSGYSGGGGPYGGTGDYTPPPAYTPPTPAPTYTPPAQVPQPYSGGTGASAPVSQTTGTSSRDSNLPTGYSYTRPALGSAIDQYFFPAVLSVQQAITNWERQFGVRAQGLGANLMAYLPFLFTQVQTRYMDRATNINMVETYAFHVPDVQKGGLIHWDEYRAPAVSTRTLLTEPFDDKAVYGDVSPGLSDRSRMAALKKEIVDYIYQTAGLTVPRNPSLDIYGMPGASFNDFRMRVASAAREGRDAEVDKITSKYEVKFDQVEDRYRKESHELQSNREQLKELGREELFTMGEAFMSLMKGRTAYTLSRVSRARRYKSHAKEDLTESEIILQELESDMDRLQGQFEQELNQVQQKWAEIARQVEEYRLTPYKKDINVEVFGVAWIPQYLLTINNQPVIVNAWESARNANAPQQLPPQNPQLGGGYGGDTYQQGGQGGQYAGGTNPYRY